MKNKTNIAISPVLETTYTAVQDNIKLLLVSPGISYINSNLTLEALVQLPVYQSNITNSMEQNPRLILGFKYMF